MAEDASTIVREKNGRSIVTVTLTPEAADAAEKAAFERLGSRVQIKGFRPGKAPEAVLREKIDPDQLFEETVRTALRSTVPFLLKEHALSPILPPRVEAVSRMPMTLKITFVERPPVTVKNAEKLAPKKEEVKIDQKDIDRVIQSATAEQRTFAVVDRPAKNGDRVTVRFSAVDKDGNDIPGLRADSERLVLGESGLLPGFEDEVVGMTPNSDKTFTLTLPEKFAVEALQKTKATFTVHADTVEDVTTPTFDDAFAKEHLQQPSAQAFTDMIEKTLRDQETQFQTMSRERALLDSIRDNTKADLPEELVDEELRSLVEEWATRLERSGRTVEDALKQQGKTAKQVEEELRTEAKNRWLLRLGIAKLIDEQKIELSADEEAAAMSAFLASMADDERSEAQARLTAKDPLYDEVHWRAMVDKLISSLLA